MDEWVCAMVTWLNKTSYLLPYSIKLPRAIWRTRVLSLAEGNGRPGGVGIACPASLGEIWCKTKVKACLISQMKAKQRPKKEIFGKFFRMNILEQIL